MRIFKNHFPGVATVKDRHGRLRYRLRRTVKARRIDCYIPGPYGSPEFRRAYEEAIEGARAPKLKAKPGTFSYLIEGYLASAAFANLSPTTKKNKRARLDWIRDAIGPARPAELEPHHVEMLMEKKAGPTAANLLRKDLAQLFRFAAKRYGFKGENPAALADAHKVLSKGFHTWTNEEIATYREAHPTGSKARLALEIFLCTGAARQDAAALTRGNVRGARLYYRRGKTGQEVDLPILPELAKELAYLPPGQMVLLAHGKDARPYSADSLGNWFRDICSAAGLPHCSAHGLRKAGARRLAEAGATEFEVMAFLAHGSAKEASRYTAAANRSKLTDSGMAKLDEGGTGLSNPLRRLDISTP